MEGNQQNPENRIESKPAEKGIDAATFFGRNEHFAFIYRKTEKLVAAVYMITNFIKDAEPLKWKVREAALSLMEVNVDINTVSLSERRELLREYQALALEIVSFSGVAHHSGLISEMNYAILAREFNSLVSTIEKGENRQANEQTVILDPGFFDTPEPSSPKRVEPSAASAEPSVSFKAQPSRTSSSNHSSEVLARMSQKHEYLPMKDIKSAPSKPSVSGEPKDSRRNSILKLLSKKSGLSIKDFAESVHGCSEKTIQRELLAMVASGVLKKEGERRWSTYSLAS